MFINFLNFKYSIKKKSDRNPVRMGLTIGLRLKVSHTLPL